MENNLWKVAIVIAVIIVAGIIIVPKFIGQDNGATDTGVKGAGASQPKIDEALKSGKATLLLLRSET